MGYQTDFRGQFTLDHPLTVAHKTYLEKFAETRRMQRDPRKLRAMSDPIREAAGLPLGPEGAYFVSGKGYAGQDHDESVLNCNHAPAGQPGLWCQWVPNEDGTALEWDEGEKFYDYIEWIKYLIDHFLKPWGYSVNGEVEWRGESWDDTGTIQVTDNVVKIA